MEDVDMALIEYLRCQGKSYKDISERLQTAYPNNRGFSARSVRRYCVLHGISKLSDSEVDDIIGDAVREVGCIYGRRMMKGYLESKSISVGESKVSQSLQRVAPNHYASRRSRTMDRTNPRPYFARCFGHKLHLDQNEKLINYGVTHVISVDGYSGKIVTHITSAVKNNLIIYDRVWRSAVLTYGLWDQLRIDCGTEFYLTIYIQANLRSIYGPPNIRPFCQTTSTQNLCVERIWPHINSRVNYPIKRILPWMEEHGHIDMTCEVTKFCVSFVTICVSAVGVNRFVAAWNSHYISGKGVPNNLAVSNNQTTPVSASSVPSVEAAVDNYHAHQGHLTIASQFGSDPLRERQDLILLREQQFLQRYCFEDIFTNSISGDHSQLVNSICFFIDITIRFSNLV